MMPTRYLLWHPARLEILALHKLSVWIETQIDRLTTEIEELIEDSSDAEAALSKKADIIRKLLQCNAPRIYHDRLLSKNVATLYYLLEETELNIIARVMVETLFTVHVTYLSLTYDQFIMFQNSLASKAHLLTGLVNLNFHFDSSNYTRRITVDIKDNIIKILEQLPSLKYLNLTIIHTDKILKCVVKNCPLIEELTLGVYHTDDDSIRMIAKLRNLKSITFRTPVSSAGIETILLSCKNLESINIICDHAKLSKVIHQLASSKTHADKLFNLKTYKSGENTLEELHVAFRKCPLIQNLTVYPSNRSRYSRDNIITAITDLHELRELRLFGQCFYRGQVNNALQVVGCHLEHLELIGVIEIDFNAVIDISQMCPNLRSLTLKQCVLIPQTNKQKVVEIPPFTKLEKITLDLRGSFSQLVLEFLTPEELDLIHESAFFLLSNCLNIEYIVCNIPLWLTENVMLKIMEKNPLTYLRLFTIWNPKPGSFTLFFVERLIKNGVNQPEVLQIVESRGENRIVEQL